MPDLTMCKTGCQDKKDCYRYRAYPSEGRQSYFDNSPGHGKGTCPYFVDVSFFTKDSVRPLESIR